MVLIPPTPTEPATDEEIQLAFNMVHMLDGWCGDAPSREETARLIERLRVVLGAS
jgi:hypothetical protein